MKDAIIDTTRKWEDWGQRNGSIHWQTAYL